MLNESEKKRAKKLAGLLNEFFEPDELEEYQIEWICDGKSFHKETYQSKEKAGDRFKNNFICNENPNGEHVKILRSLEYINKGYNKKEFLNSSLMKRKEYKQ